MINHEKVMARLECLRLAQNQMPHGIDNVMATAKRYEDFIYAEPVEPKPETKVSKNKKSGNSESILT